MNHVKLTRDEIKKLVYRLHESLHEDQRALIAGMLEELMRQHGEIWPEDLHRALQHLRAEFKISEIEAKAISKTVFGA